LARGPGASAGDSQAGRFCFRFRGGRMACSALLVSVLVVGAAGAPASSLRGSGRAAQGKCCFNGCDDEDSCVTGHCASQELCLKPQRDGGCDSSPPYGDGAKPSWCPAAAPNATEGKCCFNGCDDENTCVTGYCASQELCLKPQRDGGCDSSPPYGDGAKPSWCPAAAPKQLRPPQLDNVTANTMGSIAKAIIAKAIMRDL